MVVTDGWLCFDRGDRSLDFAEFDFAEAFSIAPDYLTIMRLAKFVDNEN
ncbi:hypothetical protein [Rhizobium binae]